MRAKKARIIEIYSAPRPLRAKLSITRREPYFTADRLFHISRKGNISHGKAVFHCAPRAPMEPVVFKTNCSNRLRKHKEKIETRGRICRRFNCLRRRRAGKDSPSQPRAVISSLLYCEHSGVFCFCVAVEFDSARGTKKDTRDWVSFFGDSWENRTPVSALRGPCLSRLTNEPSCDCPFILS